MIFSFEFFSLHWKDLLDILLVAFIFYRLYLLVRGTVAIQIFLGLLAIIVLTFVSRILELEAMNWILSTITQIWVIAFIILFQPELRRLLLILGRNKLIARIFRYHLYEAIDEICDACEELSQKQIGALIVLVRTTGIRMVIETGVPLQAVVTKELLLSIFHPRTPLHDGAVVIRDRYIEAARCTLPLTEKLRIDGFVMGMRHRSAVGISEDADVLAIVVSEETGIISVAEEGVLHRNLDAARLKAILIEKLNINTKNALATIVKDQELQEEIQS